MRNVLGNRPWRPPQTDFPSLGGRLSQRGSAGAVRQGTASETLPRPSSAPAYLGKTATALNDDECRTGHTERRAGQMAHIKRVRLPVPRRIHATDFWNGLAASVSSRRWEAATAPLPRSVEPVDVESTLCRPVGPLLGFGDGGGDETHEVPAATWLPGRAVCDGCALGTAQQAPSPPFRPGRPSRLGLCSTRYPSGIRPAGARLPPSLPRG